MSLTRDQEGLLELLVNVKEFLDENGITFYLFGGSCIGALRHHGFIPWDDDIDIILDRENYEKLIAAAEHMSRDDMEFWSFERSDAYFKAFGQFSSKKDTYFLKSRVFNQGLCMGTIIDVFVLDYVPSDRLEEHKKNLLLYEDVLGFYRLHRDEIDQYKDEYFELVRRERREGRRPVIEELQSRLEQYSKDESDLLVTRFWVRKLREYRKEWFGEPRYCEFEGHMMPIPANAEATLRQQYGYDWYNLPATEQRRVHNFYVNHEISNNNYVEDMEKFINTDNIVELLEGRKHHQVDRVSSQVVMKDIGCQLAIKRLSVELKSAIEDRDFPEFEPILKHVNDFKGQELTGSFMPEETLLEWMLYLIREGRYYDSMKVADSFLGTRFTTTLDDELESVDVKTSELGTADGIKALINRMMLLAICYQDGRLSELEAVLAAIPEALQPEIADCLLAGARIAVSKRDSIAIEKGIADCRKYLDIHPENFDVMKALADLLRANAKPAEAGQLYNIVRANSHNGLDILALS